MSGGIWATIGKMVAAVGALALNMLLTRLLEPEAVGAYYLLISVVFIGALLSQIGVHQAIVKLVAGVEDIFTDTSVRSSINSSIIIFLFGTFIVAIAYMSGIGSWLGGSVFDSALVAGSVVLTAVIIVLRAVQVFVSQLFRGFHNIGYATIFEGTSTSVFLVVILFYFWFITGTASFHTVLVSTIAALCVSMLLAVIMLKKPYQQTVSGDVINIQRVLSISMPLFVAATALPGFAEAHIWILGGASDEDSVAVYGSAYRLAKFVVVPLLIVNSVIPPMIAQLVAQKKMEQVEKVLRATATVAGIPSVLIVLIFFIAGSDILSILFGDFYAQGSDVLMILVFAQAINALTGSPGVLLMMSGKQKVVMKCAIISGTLGVTTSILLVDSLSYTGVAYGVAVGMVLNNIAMWFYCRKTLNVDTHMGIEAVGQVANTIRRKFGI
jgi:O-antigen/teichoic acid export membrane protein